MDGVTPHDEADVLDTMGGLLKIANEAGGRIDPHRIKRRPPTSLVRASYNAAVERNLVNDAGYITPTGYRWLGSWLDEAADA